MEPGEMWPTVSVYPIAAFAKKPRVTGMPAGIWPTTSALRKWQRPTKKQSAGGIVDAWVRRPLAIENSSTTLNDDFGPEAPAL